MSCCWVVVIFEYVFRYGCSCSWLYMSLLILVSVCVPLISWVNAVLVILVWTVFVACCCCLGYLEVCQIQVDLLFVLLYLYCPVIFLWELSLGIVDSQS